MAVIGQEDRTIFIGLADVLIPEAVGMPSASGVGVQNEALDRILTLRPDLEEAFRRGVAFARGKDSLKAAEALNKEDAAALSAIGLVASAAYYMSPRVRTLIGYPGQERRTYDPDATPEYVANGMLKVVQDRGPIFRPTPSKI